MTPRTRILTAVAGMVVVVATFVILQPGGDDAKTATTTTTAPAVTTTTTTTTGTTPVASAPSGALIRVKGGKPVGGVRNITVHKGDVIRLMVTADAPEEVHMHGYDIAKDVGPGAPARYDVPATITGIFEVELEHSGVPIAQLTVEP